MWSLFSSAFIHNSSFCTSAGLGQKNWPHGRWPVWSPRPCAQEVPTLGVSGSAGIVLNFVIISCWNLCFVRAVQWTLEHVLGSELQLQVVTTPAAFLPPGMGCQVPTPKHPGPQGLLTKCPIPPWLRPPPGPGILGGSWQCQFLPWMGFARVCFGIKHIGMIL